MAAVAQDMEKAARTAYLRRQRWQGRRGAFYCLWSVFVAILVLLWILWETTLGVLPIISKTGGDHSGAPSPPELPPAPPGMQYNEQYLLSRNGGPGRCESARSNPSLSKPQPMPLLATT